MENISDRVAMHLYLCGLVCDGVLVHSYIPGSGIDLSKAGERLALLCFNAKM